VDDTPVEYPRCWPRAVIGGAWLATALLASTPLVLSLPVAPYLRMGRWGALALLVLAAMRPFDALLVAAALAPLGDILATLGGSHTSFTAFIMPALLVGIGLRSIRRPAAVADPSPALTVWATLLAMLALASTAVEFGTQAVFYQSPADWWHRVVEYLSRRSFLDQAYFPAATAGFQLAQGALLVPCVARVAQSTKDGTVRVATMIVLGAATTGALSLLRLITVAVRSGEFAGTVIDLGRRLRITSAFADVNAAGSYFAMAAALAGGLVLASRTERHPIEKAAAVAGLVLSVVGLWLSGSRVAFVALPLAFVVFALVVRRGARWWTWRRAAWAGVGVFAVVLLMFAAQAKRSERNTQTAVNIRVEFARTTWRMLQAHPVFGVGVGRYLQQSGVYATPALKRYYARENAHNNFLQIAGELGPGGLVALLGVIGVAITRGFQGRSAEGHPAARAGIVIGVTAFLLTCVGGHPLLITEVAATFWITLGVCAGLNPAARSERFSHWTGPAVLVGVSVVLAGTLYARVASTQAALDLEHVAIGTSLWQKDPDGTRYRIVHGRATFFVPAAGFVRIPLRLPRGRDRDVELWLDGHLADVVRVPAGAWSTRRMLVPRVDGRLFRRLEVRATASGGRGIVQVGRISREIDGERPVRP
jgi:O-antigen ligase